MAVRIIGRKQRGYYAARRKAEQTLERAGLSRRELNRITAGGTIRGLKATVAGRVRVSDAARAAARRALQNYQRELRRHQRR